ncbi:hypothetical protein GCM10010384_47310 [Streptomyces djakartensis]|uniref:Transposase n=1 Tax=Streptomyces djakartensis TaxID=68193 RepID=A0ABQ3A6F7_9ACTN|nr:hypothetical protein GCM10010384_47310 [Streptomyces djakartensis]
MIASTTDTPPPPISQGLVSERRREEGCDDALELGKAEVARGNTVRARAGQRKWVRQWDRKRRQQETAAACLADQPSRRWARLAGRRRGQGTAGACVGSSSPVSPLRRGILHRPRIRQVLSACF